MNGHYDLDGNPRSLEEWAVLFEARREDPNGRWVVGRDTVGEIEVSTVWMGLDHSYGDGLPLIYETMLFGGDLDGETHRWPTRSEAEAGHARLVEELEALEAAR